MDIQYPTTSLVYPPVGSPIPVPATLQYDSKDPYAVSLMFGTAVGESVTWTFARDLLFASTADTMEHVGRGDITFHKPALGSSHTIGSLDSPFGKCKFALAIASVKEFLAKTEELVPLGAEPAAYVNLDDEIEALLGAG